MSPPTEQLIRDYLNRLSIAARGQLDPDDRRALVRRTRDFIERKTGIGGPPTAIEVARLLSGLGDPAGLVDQETRRLAALRGEAPQPKSSRSGRLARVLRRANSGASWHWPVQQGSRADLQQKLITDGPGPSGLAANGASQDGPTEGDLAPDAMANGVVANGAAQQAAWQDSTVDHRDPGRDTRARELVGLVNLVPRQAGRVADRTGSPAQTEPPVRPGRPAAASRRPDEAGTAELPDPATAQGADDEPAGAEPSAGKAASSARAAARKLTGNVINWSRRRPLESAACVLLGLGGAIYPPIWLLGAALALASRVWDYRDKWLGLAAPVLLTIAGLATAVSLVGGRDTLGQDVHVGWVYADVLSRVFALLGASYLAWRSVRGKRPPAVPPWTKHHRLR